uniref:Uncharacterized protein n=1 Tax=Tanacetum cinerariifolium TaxID=118510 RepID=A0A6L2J761_TANCI|nr:hypothetical protein [Tanacetum cinerariifolium]
MHLNGDGEDDRWVFEFDAWVDFWVDDSVGTGLVILLLPFSRDGEDDRWVFEFDAWVDFWVYDSGLDLTFLVRFCKTSDGEDDGWVFEFDAWVDKNVDASGLDLTFWVRFCKTSDGEDDRWVFEFDAWVDFWVDDSGLDLTFWVSAIQNRNEKIDCAPPTIKDLVYSFMESIEEVQLKESDFEDQIELFSGLLAPLPEDLKQQLCSYMTRNTRHHCYYFSEDTSSSPIIEG